MQGGEIVADRFVIETQVAAGGMGTVYRAHDRVTGVPVAVKLVAGSAPSAPRFAQEARVLCDLEHPAIVRYVAHGADAAAAGAPSSRAYLVMEWLEGEDLAARLRRGPLGVEEALAVGRRVADALAYAHARGVVHRDVKPGNLFLVGGEPARTKVLDFGIARLRAAAGTVDTPARPRLSAAAPTLPVTRTGATIGTVGYMSPEQARGDTDVDARTDVFALGCVLFECLAGRPAFAGPNAVAVLARVLLEEAPRVRTLRRDVPAALDELLARMLAKTRAERPRDILGALAAIAASSAHGTPSTGGGPVTDREQRLVCVVLAKGVAAAEARGVVADADAIELADGAVVVALRGVDPATYAAAAALALRRDAPAAAIAVATGRVLTGHDASIGPVIDRAATLAPGAGETLVDELSATLLRDRFEIDGARRLVGPARQTAEPRTLLGRRTPCVGRDKEIALLEATFRECADDAVARAVLLTAPAGGGKSRLQHELTARVGGAAAVLFARADPMGAGSSLGLARQLVQCAAAVRDGDADAARHRALRAYLARLFSDDALELHAEMLGELIGAPPAPPGPALRAARDDARILATWLRRSFEAWLVAACDQGALLVVLEDVHWGDRASLALLEEALRQNAARPLMVLALARPEVHELFPALWSRVGVQEVRLPGLTRRAAERLVRALLPEAPDAVVAHVVERAEGNAFCLEELIRHVAEGRSAALPDTVLALAEARVAALDAARRRVLRAASVFGEVFWDGAVAALLDDARDTVAPTLRALLDEELLVARASSKFAGERELSFRHGLLRDVAYAMVSEEDRARAHLGAGEWLERVGEKDARVLAEHFERSSEPSRAARYLSLAAERAFDEFDVGTAEPLVERALALGAAGEQRGRLRLMQAMAAMGQARRADALGAAREAYELLRERTPHRYLAAALTLQAGMHVGDFELAPQIVQDLLADEPDAPSGPYGLALQFVTDILDSVGQRESADALIAKGRRFAAAPACDPVYLGWFAYAEAATSMRRGDLAAACDAAHRAQAHFDAMREPFGAAITQFGVGTLYAELGCFARARDHLRRAAAFFARDGSMIVAWCRLNEAWTLVEEGRPRDALEVIAPLLAGTEFRHACAIAAFAHHDVGELGPAEGMVARALDGIDAFLVTPWVVSLVHVAHARVLHARGRDRAALAALDAAEQAARGLLLPGVASHLQCARVESLRALGEHAAARALLDGAAARIRRQQVGLDVELARSYAANVRPNARLIELAGQSP